MPTPARSGRRAALALGPPAIASILGLPGCQSYRPAPLDLTGYRAVVESRAGDAEQLRAFAASLEQTDEPTELFDLADGVSPAEGEVLALFYNPELRIARMRAGVALAAFEHAGLWEDPVFGFNAAEILSSASPLEYGLTVSLTIPISGRLGAERDRAGAAHELELLRIHDAEWRTRARVRRSWSAWTVADMRARLLAGTIARLEQIVAITDRLEAGGGLSRVEARVFRMELAERRATLRDAELQLTRARVALLALMGLSPDAPIELQTAFVEHPAPETDDALSRLLLANTELEIQRGAYRLAEQTLRREIREQYPDLTIGTGFGSEDDERLLLGASLPIPILNANRAGIAEARAARDLARAEAYSAFEDLSQRLANAQAALQSARAQRERYTQELVPMLDEQDAEIERIATLGEVDTLLLLDALTRGFQARSRLLDLRLAEVDAAIEITELLGPEQTPPDADDTQNPSAANQLDNGANR